MDCIYYYMCYVNYSRADKLKQNLTVLILKKKTLVSYAKIRSVLSNML